MPAAARNCEAAGGRGPALPAMLVNLLLLLLLLLLSARAGVSAASTSTRASSPLAQALTTARADVLAHIEGVEAQLTSGWGGDLRPPPGSIGAYLLDNHVYRRAAMFSLFNTTFLNEDISGATDTDQELVFQATGCGAAGCAGSPGDTNDDPHAVDRIVGDGSDGLNADMWLRDSGAQMHYYVASGAAAESPALTRVIQGLLREHARYVLLDSYANSFTGAPFSSASRVMRRGGFVNTGNYEPDGWCWSVLLAHALWKSGATAPDDAPPLFDFSFKLALEKMMIQFRLEQDHEHSNYRYVQIDGGTCSRRHGTNKTYCDATGLECKRGVACRPQTPLLPRGGLGNLTNFTGMTWVGFRPSDNECGRYNIPVNAMVAVAMRKTADLCRHIYKDDALAVLADSLAAEIELGIEQFGIVEAPGQPGKRIYSYSTDGLGNHSILDDANTPSLLSLQYFNFSAADPTVLQRTREWVLSVNNPWYHSGRCAKGVGSSHTPGDMIWPMALISVAITSQDEAELGGALQMLLNSDCGTGYMHESFSADDGCIFTRDYFAWPNSFFAEMLEKLMVEGKLTKSILSLPRHQCGKKQPPPPPPM
jgi:meiotically up-regulated gene 157 (Mug157) protein